MLVEYGPGGYSPGHTHAKSAFIYATVFDGAIRSQVNDGPVTTYVSGATTARARLKPDDRDQRELERQDQRRAQGSHGMAPCCRAYRRANPKFVMLRSRISRSDGAFCNPALVIYWTRGRAVPSKMKALFCSGVGVAESVITALGA